MSELDIAYICRTTAKGSGNRPRLVERGGKVLVPYLIDPNTGVEMYESEDIIDYLHEQYGNKRARPFRALAPINTISSVLASAARPFSGRGSRSRTEQPEQLLELYNFEASPYCRKVREVMCELDLDYLCHNVAKRGARRPQLVARGGKMMVPYLIDPNTGVEMYESEDIVAYLRRTYARA